VTSAAKGHEWYRSHAQNEKARERLALQGYQRFTNRLRMSMVNGQNLCRQTSFVGPFSARRWCHSR
jgi:hypothetical protein